MVDRDTETPTAKTINKVVRALLARLSQESFEAHVGLAKGRITKWKEGQGEPKASQIWKIARPSR